MNLTTRSIQADLRSLVETDQAGKLLTVLDPEGLNAYAEKLKTIDGYSEEVRVLVRRVLGLSDYIKTENKDPDAQVDWGFLIRVDVKQS